MSNVVSRRKFLRQGSSASACLLFARRILGADLISAPSQQSLTGPAAIELRITAVTDHTLRISIAAAGELLDRYYNDGSVAPRTFAAPLLTMQTEEGPHQVAWGSYRVRVETGPLRVAVLGTGDVPLQELTFRPDENQIRFQYGAAEVYGLGPGSHPLDRRGTQDRMRNGAGDNLRILGARNPIPWLMGKGWGLYFHEPEGTFDLTGQSGIFHPGDVARAQDIFLVAADSPAQVLREYAEITGYPHLPAKWTFGFQQSHRTLDSREQILDEAKTFREKKLPCDTMIYLGTGFCPSGWNTGHGSFVFNDGVFPEPEAEIRDLHEQKFKVVLHVVNPPENLHGEVSDAGTAGEMAGDAANYWAQHVPLIRMGVDGWWPDEGDVLPTPSRLVRNRMYWEGGRKSVPGKRPFALHRNCYAGIQRWGWLWSGDVFSTWKTLETQIMMGIDAGLNGVPYWGTDIGGFVPTEEFTAELFVRWFQFGAFCPSFRCHGRTWQLRRPWGWNTGSYGPSEMGPNAERFLPKPADLHNAAVEDICRRYLNLRYQLLPYLYSAAWETHTTGLPLIRSLGLAFPDDPRAWQTVDAYLFGPQLLIAPVYQRGASERTVYLPAGEWWDFWTNTPHQGGSSLTVGVDLATLPIFVRAGTILPIGPVKQYAMESSADSLRVTVYPGADGRFALYDDDGESFAYEHGDRASVLCEWNNSTRVLRLTPEGRPQFFPREIAVGIAGLKSKRVPFTGTAQTVQL